MNDEPRPEKLVAIYARYSTDRVLPFEDPPHDNFDVTIETGEAGDPDRFHITSISPRPRR